MIGHLVDQHEPSLLAVAVLTCLFASTLSLELAKRHRADDDKSGWTWMTG